MSNSLLLKDLFAGLAGLATIPRYTAVINYFKYLALVILLGLLPAAAAAQVVISEVMYHPAEGLPEYIELVNRSAGPVPLYDPATPTNTWWLTSAVRYTRSAIEFDGEGADNSEIDIDPWLFQLGAGVSF